MSRLSRFALWSLSAALIALPASTSFAAPLAIGGVLGRIHNSGNPFVANLVVKVGDVVDYEIVTSLNVPGTSNVNGGTTRTINGVQSNNAATNAGDGVNALKFNIAEATTQQIQVELDPANAALGTGWGNGTGATVGTSAARTSGSLHDIVNTRPIQGTGVFVGADAADASIVLTGTLTVQSVGTGAASQVTAAYNLPSNINTSIPITGHLNLNSGTTGPPTGSLTFNGSTSNTDPMFAFTPLTLTAVPEPGTFVLFGLGAVGLAWFARRKKSA